MKKRILSIFLALFVLIAAMPFGTVMAEDAVTEDITAADSTDSFAAEITLTEPDFPKTTTSFLTANDFLAQEDYIKFSSTDETGATISVADGKATVSAIAADDAFNAMIYVKSAPDTNADYLSIHVDTTELSATEYFELSISNQAQQLYNVGGAAYYFLPDATADNPNPELVTRTTTGNLGDSVWKERFALYPDEVGTIYIPESVFFAGEGGNSVSTASSAWNGDFGLFIKSGEEWRMTNNNRALTSLRFNSKGGWALNDTVVFSNMQWISIADFALSYNAEYVDNDFSDTEATTPTGWADNSKGVPAFTIADGALNHTLANDTWTEGVLNYGYTVDLDYPVTEAFEAIMYDVDFSMLTTAPALQITYNVKNTNFDKNKYIRRFIVSDGQVYAVWENGVVETVTVGASEWPTFSLPAGFKGTVVIPFESLKNLTVDSYTYNDVTYEGYTYDGTQKDLYKTDDANSYSISITTRNVVFDDYGKVITNDNFGYLTTLKPVLEEGTVFSADAPVETDAKIAEEIDTIEAWVKVPEGTAAGTILANKYRIADTTSTDSMVLSMNASGNPVLYLSDGDGLAVNFEVSDVDLRTDKWTHIAFVKNTETSSVNCYINGMLESSTAIPEGFGEVKPYHSLTIGHYIADELGTATFGGEVSSLKLWNKALTSSEILSSAINEATVQEGLISAWTLSGENGYIDIAGNYNLEVYDLYTTAEDEAYAEYSAMPEDGYTMVVLPDTQIANQREALTGDSTAFSEMYDWIVANKEALNIQFAMGIGDITNKDDPLEYALAKQNFDKLTAAGIGWSVVGGNHDFAGGSVAPNDTTNMNAGFPASELSTYACFGGFMEEGKMDNSYYYITVNETKYLILNLMCEPYDSAVEWGNQVCAKNKDCKIIVITHEYLTNDADFRTTGYCTWDGRNNHGIQLWDKLVSQHENIIMAIGGHVSVPDIEYRVDLGVNGNKVINVLVDGQALDWDNPSHNLLMLLKFSKDGSQVTFNYYSPTYDAYLDANNQFTLSVDGVTSSEAVPAAPVTNYTYTKYHSGEIIREYEWFKKETKYISTWSDTNPDQSTVSIDNFSWYNNMLKFTAPAEFNIDSSTVTEESTGTAYATDRIGITVGSLPNVVNENQTAISFYVDLSGCEKTTSIKIAYNNGTTSYQAANGGKLYLVDNDGNVTEKAITSNWASVGLPAGYKGTVVIPFSSFCSDWGNGEFVDAATMLCEAQNNNAKVILYIMEARPEYEYLFNNFTYLEEYENADLVTLRKGLMNAENGEDIDVNADTFVDVRDLVRLKKLLADAYIK